MTPKSIVREIAGCSKYDNVRVVIVPNEYIAPTQVGKGPYYTTPGGTLIRHPNAYRWRKIYHGSTRLVIVGQLWLSAHNIPLKQTEKKKAIKMPVASEDRQLLLVD